MPPCPDWVCGSGTVGSDLIPSLVGTMELTDEPTDMLDDNSGDKQRIVSSGSAFTPVKPYSEVPSPDSSSSYIPQRVEHLHSNPPPFLPVSSPPGWYSSLLSSLYQSNNARRWKEQNNNNVVESDEKNETPESTDGDNVKQLVDSNEKQSGGTRIMLGQILVFNH